MSSTVKIKTQITCLEAVIATCDKLKLPAPTTGTFKLYQGSVAGLGVQLPGWKYAAVIDLQTGAMAYDNYNGSWGLPEHLDGFKQRYAAEAVRLTAEAQGQMVINEQVEEDGSITMELATY